MHSCHLPLKKDTWKLKLEYDELIFYKIIQPGNTITVLLNDKEKAIEIAKVAY